MKKLTNYRLVEQANGLYTIEQKGVFVWKSIFDNLKDWDTEPEYTYSEATKKVESLIEKDKMKLARLVESLIEKDKMKLARLNHKPKYIYPPFPKETST